MVILADLCRRGMGKVRLLSFFRKHPEQWAVTNWMGHRWVKAFIRFTAFRIPRKVSHPYSIAKNFRSCGITVRSTLFCSFLTNLLFWVNNVDLYSYQSMKMGNWYFSMIDFLGESPCFGEMIWTDSEVGKQSIEQLQKPVIRNELHTHPYFFEPLNTASHVTKYPKIRNLLRSYCCDTHGRHENGY